MTPSKLPETRFAQSGDVNIAYQVMGEGPLNLVVNWGMMSHVEFMHELPGHTDFLRRLSRFARVAIFDKRGQGCPIASSAFPRSRSGWTTCARSWTR